LDAEFSGGQTLPTATATAMGATAQAVPDITLLGAHVVRTLPAGLTLTVGVHNLTDLRLAERSPLFTQVERPRSWRVALRGRW
jgi:outer membrane receptor for ferrienterochelin and colicins